MEFYNLYILPFVYGTVGWIVQVVWNYYNYSNMVESQGKEFDRSSFIKKYDQSWVMGFVGMIGLAMISDYIWEAGLGKALFPAATTIVYNAKINVILGFAAIRIIAKFDKSARSKDI